MTNQTSPIVGNEPPRRITGPTYVRDPGRKNRWRVRWYQPQRRCQFLATEKEANEFVARLHLAANTRNWSIDDMSRLVSLLESHDVSPQRTMSWILEKLQLNPNSIKLNVTFRECADEYLTRCERRGLEEKTLKSYRGACDTISREIGDLPLFEISAPRIEKYLAELPNHKGETGLAAIDSKRNYFATIRRVMKFAGVREPLADVILPRRERKPIKFYTPEQGRIMFKTARPEERGALAVHIIAGVRPTAAGQLDPLVFDYEAERFFVTAEESKVDTDDIYGAPGEDFALPSDLHRQLWAWLHAFPYQPVNWPALRARLKRALGGFLIQDGTRHTAATYAAKMFGLSAAQKLLHHARCDTTIRYYVAKNVTREMAKEFYAITPESIGPYVAQCGKKLKDMTPEKMMQMLALDNPNAIAKSLGSSRTALVAYCRRHKIDHAKIGRRRKRVLRKTRAAIPPAVGETNVGASNVQSPEGSNTVLATPLGDVTSESTSSANAMTNLANDIWTDASI